MKTIALTGATSITGLALIRQCIQNNVNVITFVRPNSKNITRLPNSNLITKVKCDLENIKGTDLPKNASKADVFFHIGWINNTKQERDSSSAQTANIPCAIDTVHLAKKMECSKYIYLGSQAEVGLVNEPINQNTKINPVTINGIFKYAAGKITNIECKQLGLEHIWVRLVSEYGSHDHEDRLIKQFIKNCKDNIPMNLSNCSHIWDYLYEDDVGEALFLTGKKGFGGKIYILGSGIGRPLREYLDIIINKVNPDYMPNYGAVEYNESSIKFLTADISEIKKDTGWYPKTSFEKGIDAVIKDIL